MNGIACLANLAAAIAWWHSFTQSGSAGDALVASTFTFAATVFGFLALDEA